MRGLSIGVSPRRDAARFALDGAKKVVGALAAALLFCATLITSAHAQDPSWDVEFFRDYQIGFWQLNTGNGFFQRVSTPVYADALSLSASITPGSRLRFSHNWGGTHLPGITTLDFWVDPGANDLSQLAVQLSWWETNGPGLPMSAYVTESSGDWYHIVMPIGDLGMPNNAFFKLLDFIKLDSATGQDPFYLDEVRFKRPVTSSNALLTIDAFREIATVDERTFGVASFTWDEAFDREDTRTRLSEAGIKMMTFPGGSSANEYDWATNSSRRNGGVGAVDTAKFISACEAIGAQPTLSINYGSGTVEEAIAWINYTKNVLHKTVKYWVIGNENYGAWEYDTHEIQHDAVTYAQFVSQCIKGMKRIDPTIKIGIVGAVNEFDYPQRVTVTNPRTGEQHNGWGPVVYSMLSAAKTLPDFIDFHYYPQGPGSEGDNSILQNTDMWSLIFPIMRQMHSDYFGPKAASNIGIYIGETNMNYWLPGKQSVSILSALYLADTWGNALKQGAVGFNWWNLHNSAHNEGNLSPLLYGWRLFGDYGMLSRGIPEGLAEPINTRYPAFFAYKVLSNFARPDYRMLYTTCTNSLVGAFAARAPNGKFKVLLINRSKERTINVRVQVFNARPSFFVTYWRYGMAEDLAQTDITTDSYQSTSDPRGPVISLPPYSVTAAEF